MDEQKLNELKDQDWEVISAKVLASALYRARSYGWTAASSLPNGKSVEGLVMEAILDLFKHPERRSSDCSLTKQLTNMVRSKLSNLANSKDSEVVRTETIDEANFSPEQGPHEKLETQDEFDRAVELLAAHPKVQGKSDHELVVLALADGTDLHDVAVVVDATGLARERVYQIRRELREIYPNIKQQLQQGGARHE